MALVTADIQDGVATVTVNDPRRRNAVSPPLVEEIVATFDRLEADPAVGALVVTGAPPAFCAGADLSELSEAVRPGLRKIYDGFLRIARCPLPTIAAVNGPAVGAGVNLALVCDLRIAAHSARFEGRFLDIALHPGGGHTWMLRRLVGPETTAAMVLFGESLDGEEAARRGLAWRSVPDDQLLPTAVALASRAARVPRELLRRAKATLRAMTRIHEHAVAVDIELEHQAWSIQQPEFAQRLAALKRKLGKG